MLETTWRQRWHDMVHGTASSCCRLAARSPGRATLFPLTLAARDRAVQWCGRGSYGGQSLARAGSRPPLRPAAGRACPTSSSRARCSEPRAGGRSISDARRLPCWPGCDIANWNNSSARRWNRAPWGPGELEAPRRQFDFALVAGARGARRHDRRVRLFHVRDTFAANFVYFIWMGCCLALARQLARRGLFL